MRRDRVARNASGTGSTTRRLLLRCGFGKPLEQLCQWRNIVPRALGVTRRAVDRCEFFSPGALIDEAVGSVLLPTGGDAQVAVDRLGDELTSGGVACLERGRRQMMTEQVVVRADRDERVVPDRHR